MLPSIPGAETTITIRRPDPSVGPYADPTYTTVATGVRGYVTTPKGGDYMPGGRQVVIDAVLHLDYPSLIRVDDEFTDALDGLVYRVRWRKDRVGPGVSFTKAGAVYAAGPGASDG